MSGSCPFDGDLGPIACVSRPAGRAQRKIFRDAWAVATDQDGNYFLIFSFPLAVNGCPSITTTGPDGTSPFTPVMAGPDDSGQPDKLHCVFANFAWSPIWGPGKDMHAADRTNLVGLL